MSYSLEITADAQLEETGAYNYYEDIRVGLGENLLTELEKCYHKISENPFYYSYLQTSGVLRSVALSRFPYIIIYLVSGSKVIILSVKNTHTKPRY